jgi:hypothetical protein
MRRPRKPTRTAGMAVLVDRPDNYLLADAVRVGDQVSTCGFSARLNRSQSRYHRGPDRPHKDIISTLLQTPGHHQLFRCSRGTTQPNDPSDSSTSRWPAASSWRTSPSITSACGPATSMSTAVRASLWAACAARSSVTGTGRASGCQVWRASRPVKASNARRPS